MPGRVDTRSTARRYLEGGRVEITQSRSVTVSGSNKMNIALKAQLFEGSYAREISSSEQVAARPLEIDVEDVNDIIRALTGIAFSRYIALEDFHYLPVDTQQLFATALKAYHERSTLSFIIVGVWLEKNRLAVYNRDLSARVVSIDVDTWSDNDLHRVIAEGERLLNIRFTPEWKADLLAAARESVYIVQEACNKACEAVAVYHTQAETTGIKSDQSARELVRTIVEADGASYVSSLQRFADGFKKSELQMYRWILYPILDAPADKLEQGLRYNDVYNTIVKARPPSSMRQSDLTLALQKITDLQVARGIKPIIFDYDATSSRLTTVDRGFLIWLENADREALKTSLGLNR